MRETTIAEKLIPSVINAFAALSISLPLVYLLGVTLEWKICVVGIFYLLQLLDTHQNRETRCFGMRIYRTRWKHKPTFMQQHLYSLLYTLSFSTVLFYVVFPFDILLANLLLLQLPSILLTGTTLHGLVAGNMRSIKM